MLPDATIRSINVKTLKCHEKGTTESYASIIAHVYVKGKGLGVSNHSLHSLDHTARGFIDPYVIVKEVSVLDLARLVINSEIKNIY